MAEGAIKELKRGSGRKMTRSLLPYKLWDHCLELEALIKSHTALDIYKIQREVPKNLLSGKTAYIFPFVEHEWYDLVKWFDHGSRFLNQRKCTAGSSVHPWTLALICVRK